MENDMAKVFLPVRDRDSISKGKVVSDLSEMIMGINLQLDNSEGRSIVMSNDMLHIYAVSKRSSCHCPKCGMETTHGHGYGSANPDWTSYSWGICTRLHVQKRRFRCLNPECSVKSFTERLDEAKSFQHRSDQLNLIIFAISVFASDNATAMICHEIGINVSHDTVNRISRNIVIEDDANVEAVGIDDVAVRKGQNYDTVVYDMKDHHLLALLEGRDGKSLEEWLKSHTKIKIIARDRASAYATAISKVLPDCLQVADRFHILQNLLGYLNDIFKAEVPNEIFIRNDRVLKEKPKKVLTSKISKDSEKIASMNYDNSTPVDTEGNEIEYIKSARNSSGTKAEIKKRIARENKYMLVKKMKEEWNGTQSPQKTEFCLKYKISNITLTKYLLMSESDVEKIREVTKYRKRKTPVNDYLNIIYKMLRDGHSPAMIYAYIYHIGYTASKDSLKNHIKALSEYNFGKRCRRDCFEKYAYPSDVIVIKRSDVLKYITTNDKNKLKENQVHKYFDIIKKDYPAVKRCEQLWCDFHKTIMENKPDMLDSFLKDNRNKGIDSFINGIEADILPIKNAISTSINSGFVEGCNCRYKSIKRTMFGRAGREHLFHKFYAESIITHTDKNSKDLLKKWLEI